jgi:hypothetical protein
MRVGSGMMDCGLVPGRGSGLTAINSAVLVLRKTRAPAVTAGILLACLADSAYALNGNIYVLSCACQTTSDFSAAASAEANSQGYGGTYLAVSSSQASSALMQVRGKVFIDKFGNDFWAATSAIPMDDSGNSLALESESALEGFYQSFDQVTLTVDRNNPLALTLPTTSSVGTFIHTSDENTFDTAVSVIINSDFPDSETPNGVMVTVTFGDHTKAQFILQSTRDGHGNRVWKWNGIAWDATGTKLIKPDGSEIGNPNTAGTGGGSVTVTGFGQQGGGWGFGVAGFGSCTSVTTITVNGDNTDYMYVHPC